MACGSSGGERERVGRARSAEVVALREVAAEAGEDIERRLFLDALRDDLETQCVGELDHCTDESRVPFDRERREERPVELELADGQLAEMRERGEARAEVVDRDDA